MTGLCTDTFKKRTVFTRWKRSLRVGEELLRLSLLAALGARCGNADSFEGGFLIVKAKSKTGFTVIIYYKAREDFVVFFSPWVFAEAWVQELDPHRGVKLVDRVY